MQPNGHTLGLLGATHGRVWHASRDERASLLCDVVLAVTAWRRCMQVLMSIQSMIFVSDPFFNEPGYESTMHTPHGKAQSASYNRDVRCNTLRLAVLQQLRSPCPTFAEAIRAHFRLKRVEVVAQCDAWRAEDAGGASTSHRQGAVGGGGGGRPPPQHNLANVCTQVKEELAKLNDGGAGDAIEV
jgi:hypothetical protein